ncbi:hypothetical protein, partial [Gordonia sp. i37]
LQDEVSGGGARRGGAKDGAKDGGAKSQPRNAQSGTKNDRRGGKPKDDGRRGGNSRRRETAPNGSMAQALRDAGFGR